MQADIKPSVHLITKELLSKKFVFNKSENWWKALTDKCKINKANVWVININLFGWNRL